MTDGTWLIAYLVAPDTPRGVPTLPLLEDISPEGGQVRCESLAKQPSDIA